LITSTLSISRILLLLLWSSVTLAQPAPPDSPLPRLLAERKVLTTQYAAANAQRNSLFGNKPSKKDLQEVVDALQGIVDKDEQIVAVLNQTAQAAQTTAAQLQTTTTSLQNTSRDDRNLTAQRLNELQNDLQNAQQREHQVAEQQRTLTADLADAQRGQRVRDALIAGLALACAGLFFWRRRR
jgi:chromosome segregation ATPase